MTGSTSTPTGATSPLPRHPPTPARRGVRRVLLVALAVVVFAVGTLVTGASIGLSTGLRAALVGLVFATVPLGIVVPCFAWLDRFEHEPKRVLALSLAFGAVVATAVSLVLNTSSIAVIGGLTGHDALSTVAVAVAPVVEELTKGIGVVLVWRLARDELDGVVDGIVYGGMVAAGFAFAENILYLGRAYAEGGGTALVGVFVLRGLIGPFAHPLFTACTGIGVGVGITARRRPVRVVAPLAGWLLAVALHALWNLTAVVGAQGYLVAFLVLQVPIFVAFVALAVWAQRREGRAMAVNLSRYAAAGWLTMAEVSMATTPSVRRRALAWAGATGGRPARQAMARFQEDAASLALLRVRIDARGHDDATRAREALLLDSLRSLRPRIGLGAVPPAPSVPPPVPPSAPPVGAPSDASSPWPSQGRQ